MQQIIHDFYDTITIGECNHIYLVRTFLCMNRMGINTPENTKMIVNYWVQKGYDSDELVKCGRKKSIQFLI